MYEPCSKMVVKFFNSRRYCMSSNASMEAVLFDYKFILSCRPTHDQKGMTGPLHKPLANEIYASDR